MSRLKQRSTTRTQLEHVLSRLLDVIDEHAAALDLTGRSDAELAAMCRRAADLLDAVNETR